MVHACLNWGLLVPQMLEKDSALIYCWRCGERIGHNPEGLI